MLQKIKAANPQTSSIIGEANNRVQNVTVETVKWVLFINRNVNTNHMEI